MSDAHRRITQLIDLETPLPVYTRRQVASVLFVRALLDQNPSDEQKTLISHYTEFLAEDRSPEGPLIVAALEALDGYLDAQKRRALATQAAEGLEKYIDTRVRCKSCPGTVERMAKMTGNEALRTRAASGAELESALTDLRAMARG